MIYNPNNQNIYNIMEKIIRHKRHHFLLFVFAFSYFMMCPSTHDRLIELSGAEDLAVLNLSLFKMIKSKDYGDTAHDGSCLCFDSLIENIFLNISKDNFIDIYIPSTFLKIISSTKLLL